MKHVSGHRPRKRITCRENNGSLFINQLVTIGGAPEQDIGCKHRSACSPQSLFCSILPAGVGPAETAVPFVDGGCKVLAGGICHTTL